MNLRSITNMLPGAGAINFFRLDQPAVTKEARTTNPTDWLFNCTQGLYSGWSKGFTMNALTSTTSAFAYDCFYVDRHLKNIKDATISSVSKICKTFALNRLQNTFDYVQLPPLPIGEHSTTKLFFPVLAEITALRYYTYIKHPDSKPRQIPLELSATCQFFSAAACCLYRQDPIVGSALGGLIGTIIGLAIQYGPRHQDLPSLPFPMISNPLQPIRQYVNNNILTHLPLQDMQLTAFAGAPLLLGCCAFGSNLLQKVDWPSATSSLLPIGATTAIGYGILYTGYSQTIGKILNAAPDLLGRIPEMALIAGSSYASVSFAAAHNITLLALQAPGD